MKLYCEEKDYKLYQGDMVDMLEVIEPESIDTIITDPPYELGFMGKSWDKAGVSFRPDSWKKCYEVLKPGGYLLAFGGSRTYHRITCAIEDAGFEIRDTIMWLYGSGFPKSMNIGLAVDKKMGVESIDTGVVSPNARPNCDKTNTLYESGTVGKNFTIKKATNKWEGWGTCLKPSFEPIIVARKPFKGTLVDNIIKNGVGGLNIDECRIAFNGDKWKTQKSGVSSRAYQSLETTTAGGICEANDNGRFPANTILTYDETDYEEVCGGFPNTKSTPRTKTEGGTGGVGRVTTFQRGSETSPYDDSGSASRYFYCAKASKRDRDEGLEDFDVVSGASITGRKEGSPGLVMEGGKQNPYAVKASPNNRNTHPTVKPTDLMGYLVRLVSPSGAVILDPFNGSGSTGKAIMYENLDRNKGYKYIGIELNEEYLPISKARIDFVRNKEVKDESGISSKSSESDD